MKSVKTNGRVEVPVEVLELARQDFLAEPVSDDQVCVSYEHRNRVTRFNNPYPFSDASNDKTVFHWKPFIHSRSAYGDGSHCCAESVYPKVRLTKNVQVVLFTEFYFISPSSVVQVVLSTAHPAKFSETVTSALSTLQGFDFGLDVLPQEFRGLLVKEGRVVDADEPNKELVKKVIESKVGSAGNGV